MEDIIAGLGRREPHHEVLRGVSAHGEFIWLEVVEPFKLSTDIVGGHHGPVPTDNRDEGEGEVFFRRVDCVRSAVTYADVAARWLWLVSQRGSDSGVSPVTFDRTRQVAKIPLLDPYWM